MEMIACAMGRECCAIATVDPDRRVGGEAVTGLSAIDFMPPKLWMLAIRIG
ncbi:hypothetical protein LWE61_15665 [Sphingobium sufflavum]|uniref:hypothetical protein n=1 Tax=Sphingobium sufflavum TaxID=1129547 RepID=UPI001F42E505|nr:hypothetical protein [Sphingobium sufflavum]MCE7797986.1 hypothetical protein [Sphingobium sufflavum]